MMIDIFTTEMFTDPIIKGLMIAWGIFQPILIPILAGAIAWRIIKWIARKSAQSYCLATGYTKRQTRKRVRQVGNVIDLVSTLYDLNDTGKKK